MSQLLTRQFSSLSYLHFVDMLSQTGDSLTADEVVEAVLEEFAAAEKALDIKLRLILCCIRGITGNSSPCPPPPRYCHMS